MSRAETLRQTTEARLLAVQAELRQRPEARLIRATFPLLVLSGGAAVLTLAMVLTGEAPERPLAGVLLALTAPLMALVPLHAVWQERHDKARGEAHRALYTEHRAGQTLDLQHLGAMNRLRQGQGARVRTPSPLHWLLTSLVNLLGVTLGPSDLKLAVFLLGVALFAFGAVALLLNWNARRHHPNPYRAFLYDIPLEGLIASMPEEKTPAPAGGTP